MISIAIDRIDNKLRARCIPQPNARPDFTYDMDEERIGVWLQDNIAMDDPAIQDELDNLVWVTLMTLSENFD